MIAHRPKCQQKRQRHIRPFCVGAMSICYAFLSQFATQPVSSRKGDSEKVIELPDPNIDTILAVISPVLHVHAKSTLCVEA
jgi:hypothetical protein